MMRVVGALVLSGFLVCVSRVALADGDIPVSVAKNPNYADARRQMQALVNVFGFHRSNKFCIVGYSPSYSPNNVYAQVYWPTQNKLIEYESNDGIRDSYFGNMAVTGDYSYVDLRNLWPNDTPVPESLDTNPPHTVDEVAKIVHDCRTYGINYVITKTKDGWTSIQNLHQFLNLRAQLQYLVDDRGRQKENEFCVLGQADGVFSGVYVYWKAREKLFFWLPFKDDGEADLDYSPFTIDLKTGLRDEEDRRSNRNEMQRSYAKLVLRACAKFGNEIEIQKSNRKLGYHHDD